MTGDDHPLDDIPRSPAPGENLRLVMEEGFIHYEREICSHFASASRKAG